MEKDKIYKFGRRKLRALYTKMIVGVVLILIVVIAGYGWLNQERKPKFDSTTIMGQIEQAQELVSTRYRYRDVSEYEKVNQFYGLNLPFTTEKSIFVYGGTLTYGIDISAIQVSMDEANKVVKLKLPAEHKIAHEMNENDIQIYDIEDSLFNEMELDDYTYLIAGLKEKQEQAVMADEDFQREMKEHTELVVRNAVMSVLPSEYTLEISR